MKRYTYQIEVYGYGEDEPEAYQDAIGFLEMEIGELGGPTEVVEVDKDTLDPIEEDE